MSLTVKYAALQGGYWMLYCAVLNYATVYLTEFGFSAGRIGVMLAAANGITALLQPTMAAAADRSSRRTLRFYLGICLGVCLGAAVFVCLGGPTGLVLLALYMPLCVFTAVQQPLINAVGTYYINRGQPLNYGIGRAMGSLMFALYALVMGRCSAALGVGAIPVGILLSTAATVLGLSLFSMSPVGSLRQQSSGGSVREFVRRYPDFVLLLVGLALMFVDHFYLNTYLYQIAVHVGGTSAAMGTAQAICAVVELPAMLLFSRLVKRFGCGNLFRVAVVFFTLKGVACMLAATVQQLYMAQCLQAAGFALYIPVSVYYANLQMGEEDKVKGQAVLTAASVLGSLGGNLSGGIVLDTLGVPAMLRVGVACSVLGCAIVFAAVAWGKRRAALRGITL